MIDRAGSALDGEFSRALGLSPERRRSIAPSARPGSRQLMCSLVLSALALVLISSVAQAQSTTTTTPTVGTATTPATTTVSTTTPASAPANANGGASAGKDSAQAPGTSTSVVQNKDRDLRWTALGFVLFALLVIVGILRYLNKDDERTFRAIALSIRYLGVVPPAEPLSGLASTQRDLLDPDVGPLEISGPAVVTVGQEAIYAARSAGQPISADWSIQSATWAKVDPASGETTSLTAAKADSLVLSATAQDAGGQALQGAVHVTSVAAADSSSALPLLGAGYGTVIIAIVAVAAVAVLGLMDVLGGEAVATFFGALLGYIFVKGGQSTAAGQSGAAPAPASQSPSNPQS